MRTIARRVVDLNVDDVVKPSEYSDRICRSCAQPIPKKRLYTPRRRDVQGEFCADRCRRGFLKDLAKGTNDTEDSA